MKKITILTYLFIIFACFISTAQTTVYLQAGGTGDGTSESTPYGNFGQALGDIVSAGDILRVIGDISLAGGQNISSKTFAFTIEGDSDLSTLTGTDGITRMFTINGNSGQDVTFKNLIFTGATNQTGSGGIYFSNATGAIATFENCTFTGNSTNNAGGGGAIFFANGTLNIIDSSFENNTSTDKGGAIVGNSGTITITNTLFKSNSVPSKGGAIYVLNANFTITGSTFYDNATTNTSGASGGAALYVAGASSTNSITNCTFFQNRIGLPNNQDYATIRTDNGTTTVINSLFYDNKTNNGEGSPADWGSGPNGTQTFNTSIAQWVSNNIDNLDEGTGSITGIKGGGGTPANLSESNLTFNATSGNVEYDSVDISLDSPIDFGTDGNDAGSWDSGLTFLSLKDLLKLNITVYADNDSKTIEINHDLNQSLSVTLFNILGSSVMDVKNVSQTATLNVNHLKTGVYILIGKSSGKYFSKKLLLY